MGEQYDAASNTIVLPVHPETRTTMERLRSSLRSMAGAATDPRVKPEDDEP
jgi:hypothetical protein